MAIGAAMLKTAEADELTSTALRRAASTIAQQEALIGELRSALSERSKIAAALVEAAKLAQDKRIDLEDLFEVAARRIESGSVKLSSYDDAFDQTPGEIQESVPATAAVTPSAPSALDPLTAVLRSARS